MEGKTVGQSSMVMAQVMSLQDANHAGNIHGGAIMKLIDTAAAVAASRHARADVVTASIDRIEFLHPVLVGNFVTLMAELNFVGQTSMEVDVRVETENLITGEKRHTSTAHVTLVALDGAGRPIPVPPLILETEEQKRRYREAMVRREKRLAERKSEGIENK